ncbi:Hsp70 family protein [Undibacterium sp. TC9W]|uniref:Hsp70 family protein n=1 Tax=Undibacterium sp. TC9W TaxID=3413053 RepID=UPI003BF35168
MIVGIDLGTTNSLIAVWKDGQAQLIANALGHVLTPSCVSINDNGEVLVGLPARDRLLTNPDRSAALFKRHMGTEKSMRLAGKNYRPEELSALVLKSLVADAEAFLGEKVTEAVITVPAYFNDTQRKATRIAGELAGLKVERLLNEPTAAALAYGLHLAPKESQFLVFDLGGGTFDVSILELFAGIMEVRATAGDNFLGGEDFTGVLVKGFIENTGKTAGIIETDLSAAQRTHLRTEAERVKRSLSGGDHATFSYRHNESELLWEVSLTAYEKLCADLLQRLSQPIERALRDSNIRPNELDRVVMVGGSTRMTIVHRLLTRLFGRFPSRDINPDEAIVIGAAVQAGLKARDEALNEVVMTDVCPYSLGIAVSEEYGDGEYRTGLFSPLIERNTVVPVSRSKEFQPISDRQEQIDIRVYQGESRETKDNIALGAFTLPLPFTPNTDRSLDIRFTYDINGLLEVEATIKATGAKQNLVIEQNPGAMSAEQLERSLVAMRALKIHPRDQLENQAMLERLKRLYEQNLGNRREWVAARLSQYEQILARQNPREIAKANEAFTEVLTRFEGAPLL